MTLRRNYENYGNLSYAQTASITMKTLLMLALLAGATYLYFHGSASPGVTCTPPHGARPYSSRAHRDNRSRPVFS